MTVFVSKGLQYPIVYLPFAFNRNIKKRDLILFHDEGVRCLHIGGKDSRDFRTVETLGRKEAASDDSRLTYVAMTRAQAQVVAGGRRRVTSLTAGCRGCCADAGPASLRCPTAANRRRFPMTTPWLGSGSGRPRAVR